MTLLYAVETVNAKHQTHAIVHFHMVVRIVENIHVMDLLRAILMFAQGVGYVLVITFVNVQMDIRELSVKIGIVLVHGMMMLMFVQEKENVWDITTVTVMKVTLERIVNLQCVMESMP
jgi:uncharacterized membrane protein (DUF485 family)